MREKEISETIQAILTDRVLDDQFRIRMADIVARRSFCCVAYDGLLYDFCFFYRAVGGDFDSGVTAINRVNGGEILSAILVRYLVANPECSLFAHNFVSLKHPFPSIRSALEGEVSKFIHSCTSMPLNLLIAEGECIGEKGESILAVVDICDGDAWLLVASMPCGAIQRI